MGAIATSLPVGRLQGIRFVEWLQRSGLTIAFLILVAVAWSTSEYFMTWSNIRIVLLQSSVTALVAVPLACLMLSGHVDLSVGATAALAAVLAGKYWHEFSPGGAIAFALAVCALIGVANGFLSSFQGFSPIIVTLGGFAAIRGAAFEISGGLPTSDFGSTFATLGTGTVATIPLPVLYAAGMFVLGVLFLYKTSWGRHVQAIGVSARASFLAGINIRTLPFLLYIVTALAAGFGGLVQMSRLDYAPPTLSTGFEIDVLTAILLGGVAFGGGRGSLFGVLIGVLFLGVLNNGLILNGVSPFWVQISSGLALVFAAGLNVWSARIAVRKRHGRKGESYGPSLRIGAERG